MLTSDNAQLRKNASTHQFENVCVQSAWSLSGNSLVASRFYTALHKFFKSLLLGAFNLVIRNATSVHGSGYALLYKNKSFAAEWWNKIHCFSSSFVSSELTLKKWLLAGLFDHYNPYQLEIAQQVAYGTVHCDDSFSFEVEVHGHSWYMCTLPWLQLSVLLFTFYPHQLYALRQYFAIYMWYFNTVNRPHTVHCFPWIDLSATHQL